MRQREWSGVEQDRPQCSRTAVFSGRSSFQRNGDFFPDGWEARFREKEIMTEQRQRKRSSHWVAVNELYYLYMPAHPQKAITRGNVQIATAFSCLLLPRLLREPSKNKKRKRARKCECQNRLTVSPLVISFLFCRCPDGTGKGFS